MILYPAIDLKEGRAVRLYRGSMKRPAKVFNDDPAAQAVAFAAAGCTWLHIVDLDGAIAGRPKNAGVVSNILERVKMRVQLGGGIRSMKTIERWLEKGVARVILGTAAVEKPKFVRNAAKAFPGQVAVGFDTRSGHVSIRGWVERTKVLAVDLARSFEDAGVAAIIHTDIDRDGAMQGPGVAATAELARAVSIPVIASGGVSSMDDLRALRDCGAGLDGAVCGRALYDGAVDLAEALKELRRVT